MTGMVAVVVGLVMFGAGLIVNWPTRPPATPPKAQVFTPPPDSAIPNDDFGKEVSLGRRIFTDTGATAPRFVGNDLKCSNCHLDAGRRANAGPLWAAYGMFPQYRAKNGHVNTFAERIQECFRYSMNGKPPPSGDPVLVALESYAAFLAKGAPVGTRLHGQGYLKLPKPELAPDRTRGQEVYSANCAMCHGSDGAGQRSGGATVIPPLWGDRSFNWGAGMADIDKAAGFIRVNMPLGQGGKLTDQQAWDVAGYIDGKPRPQDPRYTGSLADTRRRFHDTPQSLYGETRDGVPLGGSGPPLSRLSTRDQGAHRSG
jgi:thiosulfate dehydrogenase